MDIKFDQVYFDKIKNFFGGNLAKTWAWFQTQNPKLGGKTPLDYIRLGKVKRVKQLINAAFDGQ